MSYVNGCLPPALAVEEKEVSIPYSTTEFSDRTHYCSVHDQLTICCCQEIICRESEELARRRSASDAQPNGQQSASDDPSGVSDHPLQAAPSIMLSSELRPISAEVQIHDKQAADAHTSAELKLGFDPANICRRVKAKTELMEFFKNPTACDNQFAADAKGSYCKFELTGSATASECCLFSLSVVAERSTRRWLSTSTRVMCVNLSRSVPWPIADTMEVMALCVGRKSSRREEWRISDTSNRGALSQCFCCLQTVHSSHSARLALQIFGRSGADESNEYHMLVPKQELNRR